MPRTRVILRRNGSKVGEVTYASESEAVAHAAKMQGAASGIEALLAPATNRKPRKNPDWTEAELVAFLKGRPGGVTVKELVYGFGGMSQTHTKRLAALVAKGVLTHEPWAKGGGHYFLAPQKNRKPRRRAAPRRNGFRDAIGAAMTAYRGVGQAAREAQSATVEAARAGIADAKAAPGRALQSAKDAVKRKVDAIAEKAQAAKREIEHQRVRQGVNAAIDTIEEYGYVVALKPLTLPTQTSTRLNPSIGRGPRRNGAVGYEQGTAKDGTQIRLDWAFHPGGTIWTLTDHSQGVVMRTENADKAHDAFMQAFAAHGGRRNPSIGRGTKHRDAVAEAVTRRMRAQGVAKREAVSRGFAIATAAELRKNPTPIDIGSLDFGHFKKTVKIDSYYNVRTGRRFARVVSKDGTFVTDVPVADGGKGGSRAKGADAIKRRAYDQLRVHLQPTTWKPSVRVNPAGSVAYGGTTIRIAAGTYTVMPHGPAFSGPNGFVAAKKWIDSHGA